MCLEKPWHFPCVTLGGALAQMVRGRCCQAEDSPKLFWYLSHHFGFPVRNGAGAERHLIFVSLLPRLSRTLSNLPKVVIQLIPSNYLHILLLNYNNQMRVCLEEKIECK